MPLRAAEQPGADRVLSQESKAIREMHIHDINDYGSHQTVGTGHVDFTLFRPFCGPDVYLNFEVRPVEEAAKSKLALEEIFEGTGEKII